MVDEVYSSGLLRRRHSFSFSFRLSLGEGEALTHFQVLSTLAPTPPGIFYLVTLRPLVRLIFPVGCRSRLARYRLRPPLTSRGSLPLAGNVSHYPLVRFTLTLGAGNYVSSPFR